MIERIERIEHVLGEFAEPGVRPRVANKQPERLMLIAGLCAGRFPGDLAEIGAQKGITTVRLLDVAREHDRRVIVVDPWTPGTQDCRGHEYAIFEQATAEYNDILDVVRLPSQDSQAIEELMAQPLSFSYVDGLHQHGPALCDIMAVRHTEGVIAVDDVRVFAGVRAAFEQAAVLLGRTPIYRPELGIREGYLV